MQWNMLKRPRVWIPGSIIILLLIAIATLFNPAFQKSMLLRYATPHLDQLQVERIHVTPWSVNVSKLDTGFEGGHYTVEQARLRFCISSLLFKKIRIRELHVDQAKIDIRELQSKSKQEELAEPFKGIMASLEHGFAYQLDELSANANVLLPNEQKLAIELSSDGIKPESDGEILSQLKFNTGKDDDHILVNNRLRLDQLTQGKFAQIENLTEVNLSLSALPESERIKLNTLINRIDGEIETDEAGEEILLPPKDDYQIKIDIVDSSDNVRSTLTTNGIYDGSLGEAIGDYQFSASEKLLQPYAKDQKLPSLKQSLNGEYAYELADQTGNISILSDLLVSELQKQIDSKKIPQILNLKTDFHIRLLANRQIEISPVKASIADETDRVSLSANTPQTLKAPLDNLPSIIKQKNTLLDIELPEIPLQWFDFLLPDYEIKAGQLSAAFQISSDEKSTIFIRPIKPTQISGLTVLQDKKSLVDDLSLTVLPDITYSDTTVTLKLDKLDIRESNKELLTAAANSKITLGEHSTSIQMDGKINLNTYPALELFNPSVQRPSGLPSSFTIDINSALKQKSDGIEFDSAQLDLLAQQNRSLLHASLLQPIQLQTSEKGQQLNTPAGQIARIDLSDFDLAWVSAFIPSLEMTGALKSASFSFSGDASSSTLRAENPLKLDKVSIRSNNTALINNIDLAISPTVKITGPEINVRYKDLSIKSANRTLLSGNGNFSTNSNKANTTTAGDLQIDLQALSLQPVIKEKLQGSVTSAMNLHSRYAVNLSADKLSIQQLEGELTYNDNKPRIFLQADSGITLPLKNLSGSILERGTKGKILLSINQLTPEPFQQILDQNDLRFQEMSGKLVLSTTGRKYNVTVVDPVRVTNLSIGPSTKPLITPLTITTSGTVTGDGDTLTATLKDTSIIGQSVDDHLLSTNLTMALRRQQNDTPLSLYTVKAETHASLPLLLKQPALLPGHQLKTGKLDLEFELAADKQVRSTFKLHSLKAKKEMALKDLSLKLDGKWNNNGSFQLAGPIRTQGKSGQSDLNITLNASPWAEDDRTLKIQFASSLFYLNDILNMAKAIQEASVAPKKKSSPKKSKKESKQEKPKLISLNIKPDEKAFWDSLPYQTEIHFDIEKLYYTDYLIIDSIAGHSQITKDQLSISDFTAFFHDSPLRINSKMSFLEQSTTPYDLDLNASITQFDLATFLRELVPKSKPRAEGLFDISLTANGKSPNLDQYRNELLFDMQLKSRDGLFRVLDPNSALIGGSTNTLGTIGEGVSYVPTGLFGLGAVSRLVKYIKVIDYDKIDIRLTRDDSRNISINRYLVQNPELLMTAKGGIHYSEGADVLQSPMDMQAQLSFRGHGAAIMYDLDLLTKEKNKYGYWVGPTVKISGTAAESTSNLSEIITQAGNGAVLGGITRPISGLIGNIRYRWFEDDADSSEQEEESTEK